MIKYKLLDLLVWMAELPGQCYIDKNISLDAFQNLTVSCLVKRNFFSEEKTWRSQLILLNTFPLNLHNKIPNKNSNLGEKLLLTVYKPSNPRLRDYLMEGHWLTQRFRRLWRFAGSGRQWPYQVSWANKSFHMQTAVLTPLFLPKARLFTYFTFLGILISESRIKPWSILITLVFFD